MQLKKDTLGNASRKSLGEAFKCGDCLHHTSHAHSSHKEVCNKEGVRSFAPAPSCFTPDVTQVATNSDQLVQLAAMFEAYNPKQRRIVLALLRGKDTAKKKLTFGTKVFFLAFGKDYLSNYLAGYVMGYTSSNELIISGSPDVKSKGKSYISYCKDDSSLLSYSEWLIKKAELKASGRLQDPKNNFVGRSVIDSSEVQTIDKAPASWHDKKEVVKRSHTSELTFTIS